MRAVVAGAGQGQRSERTGQGVEPAQRGQGVEPAPLGVTGSPRPLPVFLPDGPAECVKRGGRLGDLAGADVDPADLAALPAGPVVVAAAAADLPGHLYHAP